MIARSRRIQSQPYLLRPPFLQPGSVGSPLDVCECFGRPYCLVRAEAHPVRVCAWCQGRVLGVRVGVGKHTSRGYHGQPPPQPSSGHGPWRHRITSTCIDPWCRQPAARGTCTRPTRGGSGRGGGSTTVSRRAATAKEAPAGVHTSCGGRQGRQLRHRGNGRPSSSCSCHGARLRPRDRRWGWQAGAMAIARLASPACTQPHRCSPISRGILLCRQAGGCGRWMCCRVRLTADVLTCGCGCGCGCGTRSH